MESMMGTRGRLWTLAVPLLACIFLERSAEAVRTPLGAEHHLKFGATCKAYPVWRRRDFYVCMRKYKLSRGRFTDQYCLTNLGFVLEAAQGMVEHREVVNTSDMATREDGSPGGHKDVAVPPPQVVEWWHCEAKYHSHLMKVCGVKDKGTATARISYELRLRAPKACFHDGTPQGEALSICSRQSNGTIRHIPILEVAARLERCNSLAASWSVEDQGRFSTTSRSLPAAPAAEEHATEPSSDEAGEEALSTEGGSEED